MASAWVLWPLLPWVRAIPLCALLSPPTPSRGGRRGFLLTDRSRDQGQTVKLGLLFKMVKLHFLLKKISTLESYYLLRVKTRYLTYFRGM